MRLPRFVLCALLAMLADTSLVRAQTAACDVADASALQATLTRCAGQRVRLLPGTYVEAPLFLASGTTLELENGATLVATDDQTAYARPEGGLYAFINAADADGVVLTGEGTIDGNGSSWWARTRAAQQAGQPDPPRPRLVAFDRCTRARISGITLQNSPSFHIVFRSCNDVQVDGVTIVAPPDSPNTDGVDPMASHNIRITDSTIDTGDDNIAVKSGTVDPDYPGAGSSDILVQNCTFLHGHGVSIGSETNGGVQNMLVADDTFRDTQNGARIKTNREVGGPISGITYTNLSMEGVLQPIAFADYYPSIPPVGDESAQPIGPTTPTVSNIAVSNVHATGARRAGWIIGLPEAGMQHIALTDVSIDAQDGLQLRNASVSMVRTRITVAQGRPILFQGGGLLLSAPAQVPNRVPTE